MCFRQLIQLPSMSRIIILCTREQEEEARELNKIRERIIKRVFINFQTFR
jgi:hypothetical protein